MDQNHILDSAERRKLRSQLPPTPLSEVLWTPSAFGSPVSPSIPAGKAKAENVPIHRLLFTPGRYQHHEDFVRGRKESHEKDYFSLWSYPEAPLLHQPVARPACRPSPDLCEDSPRIVHLKLDVTASPKLSSDTSGPRVKRLFWSTMFYAEWILGILILAFILKLILPLVVLGVLGYVVFTVLKKVPETLGYSHRGVVEDGECGIATVAATDTGDETDDSSATLDITASE